MPNPKTYPLIRRHSQRPRQKRISKRAPSKHRFGTYSEMALSFSGVMPISAKRSGLSVFTKRNQWDLCKLQKQTLHDWD